MQALLPPSVKRVTSSKRQNKREAHNPATSEERALMKQMKADFNATIKLIRQSQRWGARLANHQEACAEADRVLMDTQMMNLIYHYIGRSEQAICHALFCIEYLEDLQSFAFYMEEHWQGLNQQYQALKQQVSRTEAYLSLILEHGQVSPQQIRLRINASGVTDKRVFSSLYQQQLPNKVTIPEINVLAAIAARRMLYPKEKLQAYLCSIPVDKINRQ